ncbi:AraC family transcriptional regulator [Paenibacillus sp. GYB003]|uniref:AraC family transcriptional regulator n=1 Tax=Paenibacillus sp. GYB003 TaxID=2994392 RepID=UPI002F967CEA
MQIRIVTPAMELWRIEDEFTNVPHSHEERVQLTVPIRGTCHFTQERRKYRLDEGRALVQHPREEHHFRIGDKSGVIIIQLQTSRMAGGLSADDFAPMPHINARELGARFREWAGELLLRDPADPLAQQETESRVASYMSRVLTGAAPPGGDALPARSKDDPHVARAIEYIRARFRSALTVDELASVALQSRYHFIRSFKAATGLSPYQYVLRLRIEEAKRLLRTTRMSVTDISLHLGFASTSQLHRAFRSIVGVSPERFRAL